MKLRLIGAMVPSVLRVMLFAQPEPGTVRGSAS